MGVFRGILGDSARHSSALAESAYSQREESIQVRVHGFPETHKQVSTYDNGTITRFFSMAWGFSRYGKRKCTHGTGRGLEVVHSEIPSVKA